MTTLSKAYIRGYDWAAGTILREPKEKEVIEQQTYGSSDDFDVGARDAAIAIARLQTKASL